MGRVDGDIAIDHAITAITLGQRLKNLETDAPALMQVIERWRNKAIKADRMIRRIVLAYEAGRDRFWLARWLRARAWRRL
jgi:hypothetical protein